MKHRLFRSALDHGRHALVVGELHKQPVGEHPLLTAAVGLEAPGAEERNGATELRPFVELGRTRNLQETLNEFWRTPQGKALHRFHVTHPTHRLVVGVVP